MAERESKRGAISAATTAVWLGLCTGGASTALAGPTLATADGFGSNVTGGGGVGDVYHVTTLASDPTGVIPGSLRYGLLRKNMPTIASNEYGKRTIVFDVGGTLDLGATTLDLKDVRNVTLAGQTAPTPVVITGNTVQITGTKTSNVIFQYVTIRNPSAGEDSLSIKGTGPTTNILADHISTSWGKDEQISVTQGATNVTVQNSFATEAVDSASHAYGALIRPDNEGANVSYLKNLFANNRSRNPRPGSYDGTTLNFDFRNNTIYNYSDRAGYTGGEGGDVVNMNYVGNSVIAGPYTTSSASVTAFTVDNSGDGAIAKIYQAGNVVDANGWGATTPGLKNTTSAGKVVYGKNSVRDGTDTGWGMFRELLPGGAAAGLSEGIKKTDGPFAVTAKYTVDALTAYQQVLAGGGNFAWARDVTDQRLVEQIKAGTGDVLNAAPAAELAAVTANAQPANWVYRPAGFDTDNDGISDAWETQHNLNANSATTKLVFNSVTQKVTTANSGFEGWTGGDSNAVSPNGYSWLEVYLAELGLRAAYANNGGAWDDILAWNGVRPDAQGATATFGPAASATTVAVNNARRVGQLTFDSDAAYTLAGAGAVTLDVIRGHAIVTATRGTHALNAAVDFQSDTHVALAAGSSLTFGGVVTASGRTITLEGGGTLRAKPAAYTALLANNNVIDVNGGRLVLDYAGDASPVGQVKAILDASYASHFAGGRIRATGLAADRVLGYGDTGTGEVVVRVTLPGDGDLDGDVDFNDFLKLQSHFGQVSTRFDQGNFDYNGQTDFNDFLALQTHFGQSVTGGDVAVTAAERARVMAITSASAVPEPASMGVVGLLLMLGLKRRRVSR